MIKSNKTRTSTSFNFFFKYVYELIKTLQKITLIKYNKSNKKNYMYT